MKLSTILSIIILFSLQVQSTSQAAVCKTDLTVSTEEFNCEYTLSIADIDNGSFDYDTIFLDKYLLDQPNSYDVALSTVKFDGDTSTCVCQVNLVDKTPPVVVTFQELTISLDSNNTKNLVPEMLDNGSYDNCTNMTLSVEPQELTCSSENPTRVYFTAIDEFGNTNEGYTDVFIKIKDVNFCDTLSRCAPEGDCNSGHTLSDDVEWPCDVTIYNAPLSLIESPTIENIATFLGVSETELRPNLFNIHACALVGESIYDSKNELGTNQTIVERTFSYYDWFTHTEIAQTYTQSILFDGITTGISDIENVILELSPNPVLHTLTLSNIDKFDVQHLSIINISGRQVYYSEAPVSSTLDLSILRSGSYFIKIYRKNNDPIIKHFIKI